MMGQRRLETLKAHGRALSENGHGEGMMIEELTAEVERLRAREWTPETLDMLIGLWLSEPEGRAKGLGGTTVLEFKSWAAARTKVELRPAVALETGLVEKLEAIAPGFGVVIGRVVRHEVEVSKLRAFLKGWFVASGSASAVVLQAMALELWAHVTAERGAKFDGIYVSDSGKVYARPKGEGAAPSEQSPVVHEPSCLRDGNCDCDNPAYR